MTTYIKTSEANRYVTLARDVDLRTLRLAVTRLRRLWFAARSANTPQIPRQTR
jgi:hypothetical protein